MGLHRAGYDVTGVDLHPQPNYPFRFIQGDAMAVDLDGYDLIWASPPCQRFSFPSMFHGVKDDHPDLIAPTRDRLMQAALRWVIENVAGAPLANPTMLCGTMFNLNVYRHRYFELSWNIEAPSHLKHVRRCVPIGKPLEHDRMATVVGHFVGLDVAREAMDIDWMSRAEISQAIPPAYSKFLGTEAAK